MTVLLVMIVVAVFVSAVVGVRRAIKQGTQKKLDVSVHAWIKAEYTQAKMLTSEDSSAVVAPPVMEIASHHENHSWLFGRTIDAAAVFEERLTLAQMPLGFQVVHEPGEVADAPGPLMRRGDRITLVVEGANVKLSLGRLLEAFTTPEVMEQWDAVATMWSTVLPAKLKWTDRNVSIAWWARSDREVAPQDWQRAFGNAYRCFHDASEHFVDAGALFAALATIGFPREDGGAREVDSFYNGFILQLETSLDGVAFESVLWRALEEDLLGALIGVSLEQVRLVLLEQPETLRPLLERCVEIPAQVRQRGVNPKILEANIPALARLIAELEPPESALELARDLPNTIHLVLAEWSDTDRRRLLEEHAVELSKAAQPIAQEGFYKVAAGDAAGDYSALLIALGGSPSRAVASEVSRVVVNMAKHHPHRLGDLATGHAILRAMRSAPGGDAFRMKEWLIVHGSIQLVGQIEMLQRQHGEKLSNAALFDRLKEGLIARNKDASSGGLSVVSGEAGGLTMASGEGGALTQVDAPDES